MGRRASRVDGNQSDVVGGLRKMGATVTMLHMVGQGCPDILVGWRGGNWLFEIKDPAKPPSARALTPDQVEFHGTWRGQVDVIHSAEEAYAIMSEGVARVEFRGQIT